MESKRQTTEFAPSNSAERRACDRYAVRLNVVLTSATVHDLACVAENVSVGGVFLGCGTGPEGRRSTDISRLPISDAVKISCTINHSGTPALLSLQGKIVRSGPGGIAVRFVNPDRAALKLLLEHARALSADPLPMPAASSNSRSRSQTVMSARTAPELLSVCARTVENILGTLMTRFHEAVVESLFEAAKQTTSTTDQNSFFDALKVLNTTRDSATTSFCNAVRNRLVTHHPDTAAGVQRDKPELCQDHLAIVEDEIFDEWLADKATISSVETHCKEPLAELAQRLSLILGAEISNENNPYGPALFCTGFREAIKTLGLAHKVNLCCYQVVRAVLLKELGALYAALNQKLVANGILPVITYKVEKPAATPASPDTPPRPVVPDTTTGEVAGTQPGGAPPDQSRTTRPDDAQDIFELLGRLRRLQQTAVAPGGLRASTACSHASPQPVSAANFPDGSAAAPACYSPNELIDALEQLSLSVPSAEGAERARDYKSEVLRVLTGEHNAAGDNDIGVRESTIMDVASSIFHAMATDVQVSGRVRSWIQKLELPVLKMALRDDSLFRDRSHPLRQVINKISQLEVVADDTDEANEVAIRNAIEWIIGLINTESHGSSDIFGRAVRGLDLLLKVQDRTYSDNLRKVVEQAEQHERYLELHPDEAEPPANIEWNDVSEDARASCLKRVQRLTAGKWIVFDEASGKPRRSRIARISPRTQKLVLVNRGGVKERDMSSEELAKALHDRSATILDNADEPAMDRAQYAMLQDLHSELLHQSTHDQLTGLMSRREFGKCLSKAHLSARYENSRHAVCFIDLDHFGVVNSACGYEGGDKLLKEIASLLKQHMDDNVILARVGNDEFGVLLENCGLDDAMDFVQRRWQDVQDYRLAWQDKKLSIGASIGLVPVTQHGEDLENLLQAAESSCAMAKDMGGNRIQVFHSGHAGLSRRNQVSKWAVEVDRILDEETLYLRCQRIKPISEGDEDHSHFEVLLGVRDSDGRDMSTPEFIEAAERYHRMPEVDRWVIRNAFRWIADNQDRLCKVDGFSINLSGRSLNDAGLLQFIMHEIEATGVPQDKLCFEVTETVGVASLSDTVDFIREIKQTGCKFSLDDFGSGMSSYAYLRQLPVDFLKIDGAFVKDMVNNAFDSAVVKSICEIGHFMDMKVIAEYAENDVILEQLRALGVDYAQGYGIEKPVVMEDLSSLLSEGHTQESTPDDSDTGSLDLDRNARS